MRCIHLEYTQAGNSVTTKPSATPPEFNRELVAKAIATGTNPNSFAAKMLGVYELTVIATKQTERKYEKTIKEAWGHEKSVMESDSLDTRIQKHSQFKPNQTNAITEHYKAILDNLSRLRVEFAKIKIDAQDGKTAPTLKDAIDIYLKKDSLSRIELTSGIPIFFALQYHAWELESYLNGRLSLVRKATRTKRSSDGGRASNEGRTHLIEDMRNTLSSIKIKEKYKSIEELFGKQYETILSTLEKHEKIKSSSDGKIPYKIPDAANLPTTFRKWAVDDEEFRKEIDRLVQKKNDGRHQN